MLKKLFKFAKKKEEIKEESKEELVNKSINEDEQSKDNIKENEDNNSLKKELITDEIENKSIEDIINEDNKKDLLNQNSNEKIRFENVIDEVINTEILHNKEDEIIIKEDIIDDNEDLINDENVINNNDENEINNNEEIDIEDKKISLFNRLKQGLSKAKQGITDRIDEVLKSYTKVDEELLEELEEVLITADVGVNTTMDIIQNLRETIKSKGITEPMYVRDELKLIVEDLLEAENQILDVSYSPTIILMVGVNGVGKTTTIGKLANRYKSEGKKVLLAAGDTFRAAAIEQLEVWANRSNVDIIKHQEGADPGAVIFDAIKAAKARKTDLLICDTAGRLHNKANLMNELGKVFKIVDREFPEAKKEVLLVVDATTGQNAVSQAKIFKSVANITGIVLTKLDGTAKGGVVLAVKSEVDVPVKLIGVGEKVEDLQDFNAKAFSDALFGN